MYNANDFSDILHLNPSVRVIGNVVNSDNNEYYVTRE